MSNRRADGFSLIELIVAIVIISIGLAGVLTAFTSNLKTSADPMLRKQMLSVAEGMMGEITLKPFAINGIAPRNGRVACGAPASVRTAFNDLRDYAGYATTGVCDINGTAVAGLGSYSVAVTVANDGGVLGGLAAADVLRVTVSVTRGNGSADTGRLENPLRLGKPEQVRDPVEFGITPTTSPNAMKQMSFAVSEYVKKPKQTRKERFLQEIEHEGAHRGR